MIWGSSFLLLFFILLLLSLLQFVILKKSFRKNTPDFSLPVSGNSGESFSVNLEVFIPLLLPGFRCLWRTGLSWHNGHRTLDAVCNLFRGNHVYDVLFEEPLRGEYSGSSGQILLEDLFGFTRFRLYAGEPVLLNIYPAMDIDGFKKEQIISGGEAATADLKRVRSEELLEVRKYYPGDDARRINWKMYAASGELFLRIGEEIPPPTGEVAVVLSSQSMSINKLNDFSHFTDILVSTYITFIHAFVEKGCIVRVFAAGMKDFAIYDPKKPDALLKILSTITPENPLQSVPDRDFLYVVSHPLSESLKEIVKKKKVKMKVFIKALDDFNRKDSYRDIFYRDSTSHKSGLKDKMRLRKVLIDSDEDLFLLKKNGRGKIHGEII